VPKERRISRVLVNKLVRELKDYRAAAEVVSGSEDIFSLCTININNEIAVVDQYPDAAAELKLKHALEQAREEIKEHQEWQNEVLEILPKEDDDSGLTGPLRQAFTKSAIARSRLLSKLTRTHNKYFTGRRPAE